MNNILSDITLSRLSKFISSNLAMYFPKERWNDLERNIISASKDFGYKETEDFINHIISSPLSREHVEMLASNLTINETYFWREPQTFDALEKIIIPDLICKREREEKRIRIWSAGCSSGEEPFSIAIALERLIPDIQEWNITILATDINSRILNKARSGEYGQWSFRGTPQWLKEKYFSQKKNNIFEIIPRIKSMVEYEYLNLAEDIYPSSINNTNAMDIIYCRNVLMYFTQERFRQIVVGLYNSLVNGGYLIVSASELSLQNFPDFQPVNIQGMVLYQKPLKEISKPPPITIAINVNDPIINQQISNPKLSYNVFEHVDNKSELEINIENENSAKSRAIYEKELHSFPAGDYSKPEKILPSDEQKSDKQILLIRALANEGKIIEAINTCNNAIAVNKIDPRLHFLCATILLENNQLDKAEASLKRAIYLKPDFVLSYYLLGNIYNRLGNSIASKRCYDNILEILCLNDQNEILYESEGLTSGRLLEIIKAENQSRAI